MPDEFMDLSLRVNKTKAVPAVDAAMNRLVDEEGRPIETDEELVKRYFKIKLRTEDLRHRQKAALGNVEPEDDIIT